MGLAPLTSGLSPLGVLETAILPPLTSSQAQPEPNWPTPAATKSSFIFSTEPKESMIAFSSAPGIAPPPLGFIHFQKWRWL